MYVYFIAMTVASVIFYSFTDDVLILFMFFVLFVSIGVGGVIFYYLFILCSFSILKNNKHIFKKKFFWIMFNHIELYCGQF